MSLSSAEGLLGGLGSHLAFLWLSLLLCQTRVPSGQPILQVPLDMDAFRPFGFRERLWARAVVAMVVGNTGGGRGVKRPCICRMCQSKARGGGETWSG